MNVERIVGLDPIRGREGQAMPCPGLNCRPQRTQVRSTFTTPDEACSQLPAPASSMHLSRGKFGAFHGQFR